MKTILLSVVMALSAASFMASAQANTFEEVGIVQSVQLGTNVISVNDVFYYLPNSVLMDDTAAIFKLKPGYLIGFSGVVASPYNQIDSLYLYPESVIEAEQNLQSIVRDAEDESGEQ